MSSAHNSSFIEEEDYVHWMTEDFEGKRKREMSMDKFLWEKIRSDFYKIKEFCSREDFLSIFNKTTHEAYPKEMANDAFRDLDYQKRRGIGMERDQEAQRARIQPGELQLAFAPCSLGDRSHPKCCMNNLGRMGRGCEVETSGMVTSTPKDRHTRPAPFGDISRVVPTLKLPLYVDTTPSRSNLPTALGSQASSRRTSLSSARSARGDSVSSQEDGAHWLSRRITPKRHAAYSTHSSSSRATQVKRARMEPETGLVGVRSPATPGAQSPDWPEPTDMDWDQPSTSGPQPPKMCQKGTPCSSRCATGPCHEEMF